MVSAANTFMAQHAITQTETSNTANNFFMFLSLKLIFSYLKLNLKKEWHYKASFFMQIIMMMLNDLFFIIQWYIVFQLVDNIGGYGFNETMLLWAMAAGGFGFCHVFFGGAWKIKDIIYDGKLDVFLTQPKNVLINLICSELVIFPGFNLNLDIPLSIARSKSCAQGTNNQTIVHFSSETARRINSGFVPFNNTAFPPVKKLPNQCIFAPV